MDPKYAKTHELAHEMKVSDVMQTQVVTVPPDIRMTEFREILRNHHISGLPVMDGEKLSGVISLHGLLVWLSEGGADCPVRERMDRDPVSVFSDQTVAYAVEQFEKTGFGRFPVLDRQTGQLVGILTKGNIIEGLLQKLEMEYAEEEVRQYRASHIFEDIAADYKQIHLSYTVIGKDFDNAGKASTSMKKNLKRLGIRPDILRRLAIASYEAEMNVVIYADKGTMDFRVTPGLITLEVKDEGPGIDDIERAMQPGFTTSAPWVKEMGFGAGMGLCNIQKCADKMTLHSTPGRGTTLRVSIVTLPGGIETWRGDIACEEDAP